MFPSWNCLSLPKRIIFFLSQMAWLDGCGAGCGYGFAQSEVEIWQLSSLFDLCRQLKESTSGFKVRRDVYTDQKSWAVVRSPLF